MKHRNPTLLFLLLSSAAIFFSLILFSSHRSVTSQTRERRVNTNEATPTNGENAGRTPALPASAEVVKVDVDLVTVDALVLQKNTARIVGGLKKEDFALYEDGAKQEITHFSQDSLPLSVLLLIDRGGCLDPFNAQVHRAAVDAVARLKPVDEVAVMTYHNTTRLLQGFTRNRILIEEALDRIPAHDEEADHCLNKSYDLDAGNFAMTLDKPLTSDDQVRVVFSLVGEQGGNDKSPPKAGIYSAKADKFMKVEDVAIVSRKGGADSKQWLERSTLSGEVKVTSASADEVAGDFDLTSGDSSVKGSFTAKVLKRK